MSCCTPPPCQPIELCVPENFGLSFPSLVGPMGPAGGPGTYVTSLAELRLLDVSAFQQGYIANVAGHTTINDGGGGLFTYDATSVATDNNGTIVEPAVGPGAWFRVYTGAILVGWFHAIGDGVADDTAAITAAITAAGANCLVIFASGKTYKTSSVINITTDGVTLSGYGATITSAGPLQYRKFRWSGRARGSVLGLVFNDGYAGAAALGAGMVEIVNSSDITVRDCHFISVIGSGIYVLGASFRCTIDHNAFFANFCAIFSDDDGANQPAFLRITNNSIRNGTGSTSTANSGAIKLSGIGTADSHAGHVIEGNTIASPGKVGIELVTWVNDCTIANNTILTAGYGVSISLCTRVAVTGNNVNEVTAISYQAENSTFVAFTGNLSRSANAIDHFSDSGGSTDITITGGAVYGGAIGYHCFSTRASVVGVQFSRQTQCCLNVKGSGITVSGCTFEQSAGVQFIIIVSITAARSQITIAGNTFTGTATNGILLYAPANSITDVKVTDNNTSNMTCSGGAWATTGSTSETTRLLRIRSYDNLGDGLDDLTKNFNLGQHSTTADYAFFYAYFYYERSVVCVDSTGGNKTFELPNAIGMSGYEIMIDKNSAGNTVTVSGYLGQTINGAATVVLALLHDRVTVRSNGVNWVITQTNV